MTMVSEYLSEIVNYGGLRVTRGEMILDLEEVAKSTGRADWRSLVNIYLAGRSHSEKLSEKRKEATQ